MIKKCFSVLLSLLMFSLIFPVAVFADDLSITVVSNKGTVSFLVEDDLSSSLSKAMQYCSQNADSSNICTVTVPYGSYTLTKSVTVSSYTVLDLSNSNINLAAGSSSNCFRTPSAAGYTGCTDFTLKNCTIGYAYGSSASSCLVRIGHSKNITLDNVNPKGIYSSHLVEIAGSKNVTVKNCHFDGIDVTKSEDYAVALQIDILDQTHFPGYAPYDGTANEGITVTNCSFNNVPCGVGTHSLYAGFYQKGINISNNTFNNISSEAISCMGFINTTVHANVITNCGAGIHYYMMKTDGASNPVNVSGVGTINKDCNSSITNNSVHVIRTKSYPKASPIYIFGNDVTNKNVNYTKGNYLVNNIKISGNSVITPDYGIRLSDVKNSKISENSVSLSSAEFPCIALYESSDSNVISGNALFGGKNGIGVYSSSNSNAVNGNSISSSAVQGILFNDGTNNNSAMYNSISGTGAQGIYVRASSCGDIVANNITSAGDCGIQIKGPCSATAIESNTVTSAKGTGIYIDSNVKLSSITGNNVSKSGKFGIKTLSSVSKISSNKLKSNKKFGLCLDKNVKCSVYSNTYSGNKSGSAVAMGKKSLRFSNLKSAKIKSVKKSGKNAVIKWGKVSGANKYIVYRAASKNGKYTKLATTAKANYTDKKAKKGKKYYYKVVAVKSLYKSTLYANASAVKSIKM